jgi:hypothetical protein
MPRWQVKTQIKTDGYRHVKSKQNHPSQNTEHKQTKTVKTDRQETITDGTDTA